jgi:hypothetical protein
LHSGPVTAARQLSGSPCWNRTTLPALRVHGKAASACGVTATFAASGPCGRPLWHLRVGISSLMYAAISLQRAAYAAEAYDE